MDCVRKVLAAYLVSYPCCMPSVYFESREKTHADGRNCRTEYHRRCVVSDPTDRNARKDDDHDKTEDERNTANSGLHRIYSFNGLEPDGNIIDHDCQSSAHAMLMLADTGGYEMRL